MTLRRANIRRWRGNHHVGRQFGDLSEEPRVVDEARDVRGDESVEHAAHADGLAGEDAGVDGRLGVVPHDAADELHPGRHFPTAVLHLHFAVGVLQIAVARAGSQVDPAAEIAVAQETVVLLVRVGLDDGRFDFAADFRGVADGHIVFDGRMFDDARVASQVGGTGQEGERSDAGMAFQHDRAGLRVGHDVLAESCVLGGKHAVRHFLVLARPQSIHQVVGECVLVELDELMGEVDQVQFGVQWPEFGQRELFEVLVERSGPQCGRREAERFPGESPRPRQTRSARSRPRRGPAACGASRRCAAREPGAR